MNASAVDMQFLHSLSVLYVEDEEEVRLALSKFLRRRFHRVDVAENGDIGLGLFRHDNYDVVVTDVKMPVMDGLEMAKQIKSQHEETPVIVVTAYNETDYFLRAIEVGVDRYVKKPVDPDLLIEAIYKATRLRFEEKEEENRRRRVLDTLQQIIAAFSSAVEKRAAYSSGHQKRVAQLAAAIGREMGLPQAQVDAIRLGALIHDIGFMRVPAEILAAPQRLASEQMEIVKSHASTGMDILRNVDSRPILAIVRQHHERCDGSGYPDGLKAEAIAQEARIVAVADVVEAMSSPRAYRPAVGMEAALHEIESGRGYDPVVVAACLKLFREGRFAFEE